MLENLGLSLLLSLFSGYLLDHVPLPYHCSLPASCLSIPVFLLLSFSFPKCTPTVLSDSLKFLHLAPISVSHSLSVLSLAAYLPVCLSGTRSILLPLGRPVHRHVWSCCHFLAVSLCVRLVPCSFVQFGIFRQGFSA